jgi:hypothetical protein
LNGAYTSLETKYSDIAGHITFNYLPNNNYQFTCSKTGYTPYTFILNPITSATWDIFLTPEQTVTYANTFDRISINVNPQIYYSGNNQFNFTINSFFNELTSYSYTLTYPGGTTTNSGLNPSGEKLTSNINIVSPNSFDNVQLDITYTMPIFGTNKLTYYYPIGNLTQNTLINPIGGDPTYGLGLIERLLIVVFGAIIIAGLCFLAGSEILGMALQFIWSGYWCYVSFVPLWAFLPSMFVAIIILSSRTQ